ncbi:Haloacid dehalogenase superfamily protein, subfamily IA, variant 3 with third motif having DD or ED [Hyella patelloides LEGE 07179]|uniref:Haloacid dehalogenase superfamily protein, subfamily IA, variant 3 with third motif having DD or ED n=1 Tax=Hyella patelloides LEGE 07179 TaxID=945734 RepID=A0A563W0N8_9CYAN|nr:HAD family phosphatase [Hyella patelloides]VEP17268.1 Haloacid dehalogenase superfamily protein, subfamily IA, variant 3 with third motif having DD or ED [Hyella patelloides LEGE 07179]
MLSAILFDLDGTLANTDPIHFTVWQEIFAKYGIKCDRSFYQENISGNTNEQLIAKVLPHLSPEEGKQLGMYKEAEYRARAKTLQPMPGLERILQLTDRVPLKRAVVTNAPRENAFHMLSALNLTETFPLVVLAEDAPPGKPDPAPYLLGLDKVEVNADRAIAFEDSPTGIKAAVAAGIYTIGVASTHDPEFLQECGANMVIQDFNSEKLWQFIDKKVFW